MITPEEKTKLQDEAVSALIRASVHVNFCAKNALDDVFTYSRIVKETDISGIIRCWRDAHNEIVSAIKHIESVTQA